MQVKIQFREFSTPISIDDLKSGINNKNLEGKIGVEEVKSLDGAAGGIIFGTYVLKRVIELAKEIAVMELAEIVIETVKHFAKKLHFQITTKEDPTPKNLNLSVTMTADELDKFLKEHGINPEAVVKTIIVSPIK